MLRLRLLAALFGLPMLFVLLWLNWYFRMHYNQDDLFILLIVILIAGASGWEISGIVRHRHVSTARWNGVYAALIIPFLVHMVRPALGGEGAISTVGLLIDSIGATAAVMLLFLGVWGDIEHRGREGMIENLYVLGASLYVGITTSFVLLLGQTPFHEIAVAFLFMAVFALDTAAYFGGRYIGGPYLAPRISPKKTWSGAICGLLGSVAICSLFIVLPGIPGDPRLGDSIPSWGLVLIGIVIGITGQIGDLLESAFKRWGDVKDSGHVLPGHGGFLDRFDSLFLAAPFSYLLLIWLMK